MVHATPSTTNPLINVLVLAVRKSVRICPYPGHMRDGQIIDGERRLLVAVTVDVQGLATR
jgi:hypothetical protein